MPVLTFARYILETSLMEYKFNVQLSESLLAAATLALAMKVIEKQWPLIRIYTYYLQWLWISSIFILIYICFFIKVQNIDESKWMGPLTFYSGHDVPNIRPVFRALHQMLFQDPKDATKTIRQKYSHR